MALAAPQNDRKRVKVYELKNNDWFDRGTGFCTGQHVNDEARIFVQSEEEPHRVLLETKITKDDGYQKQQDTLIVWTESSGTDMALSFQEAEGCGQIWDFVSHEQQRLAQLLNPDDGLADEIVDNMHQVMLPDPELANIAEVENMMRAANSTSNGRDALSKFIVSSNYISKLVPLVELAEDFESLADLHRLCNMMKLLILLNDSTIIEYIVTDDIVLGVVGALEYDPDFPCHKANHRQYLADNSRFKEVVKIEDMNIKKKIHYAYRLQYLKDVVLARILDDPTFSVLNSLIFFHQVDIVQHIHTNPAFLTELFSIFHSIEIDPQRKKDAVLFIQQCCAVAKTLQGTARNQLYANFASGGLFGVITYALRHPDPTVRVAGTDILVALIDHDAMSMRAHIFTAIKEKQKPLTDVLIELLLIETDLGVKHQMADAIKVLLDPNANAASFGEMGRSNGDFLSRMRTAPAAVPSQADAFVQTFYDESARKLFKPLRDLEHRQNLDDMSVGEVYLFSHLLEVMNFFLRQYFNRSKYIFLADNLPERVAQLLACPEKHLKLSALKFFRTCLALNEEQYVTHIVERRLFEPILDLLYETMPRDNLLNSACLELFEYIRRESRIELIEHMVETYRDKFAAITYVDTFHNLIARYEQHKMSRQDNDASFTSHESADMTPDNRPIANGRRWHQGLKDPDAEEEAYFNSSDGDEDDIDPLAHLATRTAVNGASPARRLVDYPDDDDDDDMDILAVDPSERGPRDPKPRSGSTSPPPTQSQTDGTSPPAQAQPQGLTTPPERLAEKRRREDDEEDELGKLSQTKRRSSSFGSTASANSTNSHMLRRKKSINSGKDGPPKKIAISLAVKSSDARGENEGAN